MPAPSGVCETIPTRLSCQHLPDPIGLSKFDINGEQIGHDVMAPGWTDYHQLVAYQPHDVTDHLLAGTNCLGAIIGEGWYAASVGYDQRRAGRHYGGRPAFLCQSQIEFADGRTSTIVTENSWISRQGPIGYSDFHADEMYDAHLELDGGNRPEEFPKRWQPAACHIPEPGFSNPKISHRQPMREVERHTLYSITHCQPNRTICDVGQNSSTHVEMTLEASSGHAQSTWHDKDQTVECSNVLPPGMPGTIQLPPQ